MATSFRDCVEYLINDLADGGPLSSRVIPDLEDTSTLTANLKRAFEDGEASSTFVSLMRQSLSGFSISAPADASFLSTAVANARPGELLTGVLDGKAVLCLVLTLCLLESETAARARQLCSAIPADELEVVVQSTDTLPFTNDPDAVQVSVFSFLHDQGSANLSTVCCALYAANFDDIKTYACGLTTFFAECISLASESEVADNADDADAVLDEQVHALIEETVTNQLENTVDLLDAVAVKVDRATSPIRELFYDMAARPMNYLSSPSVVSSSPSSPPPTAADSVGTALPSVSLPPLPPAWSPSPSLAISAPQPAVSESVPDFDLEKALLSLNVGTGTMHDDDDDDDEVLRRALNMA
jgi:hypothetical protein